MAKTTETLQAEKRKVHGTKACRRLRAQGAVPAVLYGHGQETLAIQVPRDALLEALRHHSRMFDLKVGRSKKESVLLKEVQYDSLGSDVVHADFVRIAMDEAITVEVPLVLKGSPKAEHAVLQQTLGRLEIECLPADMPESVAVPVGHLEVGQSVQVRDLALPPGVKVLTDGEVIVAAMTAAAAEVAAEAAAPVAAGAGEPELIGRKPGEAEEAEAPEEPARKEKREKKKE